MSTRAVAAVDALPGEAFAISGQRFVLHRLADAANERDLSQPCIVEIRWIAERTSQKYSTVRRHIDSLVDEGWITAQRSRRDDGGEGPYAFFLSLEKLGLKDPPAQIEQGGAPASGGATPLLKSSTPPAQIEQGPLPISSTPPAQIEHSLKEDLPSLLKKYPWASPDHEAAALRILSVAGPRLADPLTDIRVLAGLRDVMESWLASFDLEADIVPVVSKQTARRRPSGQLCDVAVLTPDIWEHRAARKRREAAGVVAPPPPDRGREAKAARELGLTIAAIEDGARPEILLAAADRRLDGDAREAAFAALLADLKRRRDALLEPKPEAVG